MLNAELSIVDEVETAINAGSAEKRLKTISALQIFSSVRRQHR